ncbi:hypothetical protein GYMLUDRAFT_337345 [Collybiopsis luxurians FD-317 M1]|nr:hypothetical protein GYMLUDRAFT_337345 [Collybiopsis luxurians FD-317 M1]
MSLPASLLCPDCHLTIETVPLQDSIDALLSADILSKSRANHVPNSIEQSRLTSYCEDVKATLPYIDYQIVQLEQMTKKLIRKRIELERTSDLSQSLLSPIRKLPPEILNEIFLAVCSSEAAVTVGPNRPKISSAFIPVSQVCAFWRALVLSRSTLWSSLDINFMSVRPSESFARSLTRYISLSKAAEMRLRMGFGHVRIMTVERNRVLAALCEKSNQWKELHLDFNDCIYSAGIFGRFAAPGSLDYSSLEKLTVSVGERNTLPRFFYDGLRPCPRLRHFRTNIFGGSYKLDLSNVTTLHLGTFVGASLAELLARCPSLKIFHLHGFIQLNTVPDPDSTGGVVRMIRHHRLSEMTLAFDSRFAGGAWRSVLLPTLGSLSLFYDQKSRASIPEVEAMLRFSNAPVEKLSFYDFPEQSIIQFINAVPESLSHIYVSQDTVSSTIFQLLVVTDDLCLAPNLTCFSLELEGSWYSGSEFGSADEFPEVCCQMVGSRLATESRGRDDDAVSRDCAPVPLQKLTLRLPYIPSDIVSSLRRRLEAIDPKLEVVFERL